MKKTILKLITLLILFLNFENIIAQNVNSDSIPNGIWKFTMIMEKFK